jgi:hypothetical protein
MVHEPKTQKRMFWAREMKMLNDLMGMFPNEDFWKRVSIRKVDSLAILRAQSGLNLLKKKFSEFNYKIPEKKIIKLGKKTGKDKTFEKKPKTIRQFIDQDHE